ncbi:MAG: tRNA (adenosine(37)-N6)-threonylcarbamoyltransferase complex transferase subunit TsaD [Patescibacteria group bacterium]
MKILAIESSCDETAIALLEGHGQILQLKKNAIYSQIDIHKKYGGVIPEVAARKHTETIIPLIDNTLGKSKLKNIDYVAVTSGPGLVTSLILGMATAKALAFANHLPLVSVNHLEGHIYSNWLSNSSLARNSQKYLPALILLVSGGHSELILMTSHGQYQILGQTLDDAAGEAYDKVAKLLHLGYPGGPIVSSLATEGNTQAYNFPRPMIDKENYDFSFSGLKTAVLYTLEKKKKISKKDIKDICASFQAALIEVLVKKTIKAAKVYKVKSIMLAGGVAANQVLKNTLLKQSREIGLPFFYPDLKYTGDNAAMIAVAAYYNVRFKNNNYILKDKNIFDLEPQANWRLGQNKSKI